nr:hydroxyethylthiazole kinase [Butyrivibrio sp.]
LINLGNISDTRMAAMEISMKAALSKGIPVVLDAVGVSCSELRRKYIAKLLDIRSKFVSNESSFFLIKGNYSEIKTLSNHSYRSKGVDADTKLACTEVSDEAKALAKEYKVCVLASGAVDIVTDGEKVSCIRSGVPMMGNVTGTGCMLGAICACFLSVQKDIDAVICACVCFGIAGEYADANLNKRTRMDDFGHVYGNGSFMVQLLDEIYSMTDEKISLDRFNICERQER